MSVRKVYSVITSDGFVACSGSYKTAIEVYQSLVSVCDHYRLNGVVPISIAFSPEFVPDKSVKKKRGELNV